MCHWCHLFGSSEKLRPSSRGGSLVTTVALVATFAGGRKQGDVLEDFLGNSVGNLGVIWTWTK